MSTHFFAPIPETPAIAAKIFEISENVWGTIILTQDEKLDRDRLDELVERMVDTVCSNREMIRVAGDDYPAEVVRSRFLKLNASHIEYVLDRMRERESYREIILENIDYDILTQDEKLDRDRLDELVELMVDTVCSNRKMIRIAGDDYPAEVVKSRFLKIGSSHIEYVLERMRENTTYVRNIKKYLLAALYNAPVTMDSYYTSLVSHDLYGDGKRGRG